MTSSKTVAMVLPARKCTSSIVNIPSTNPIAVHYGMCIHRSSDSHGDLYYAPRDSTASLSWAKVAFKGMGVCEMIETDIPVKFTTTHTYKLPPPPSKYSLWGAAEWEEFVAADVEKASKCKSCGVRLWEYIDEWYTCKGEHEWETVTVPCECEAKCAYVYPESFSSARSVRHPTGRTVKRPAMRATKRVADQSAKRRTMHATKC